MMTRVAGLVVGLMVLVGCVEHLPPPAAPGRDLDPALVAQAREAEPSETEGVIVLDAVDGSARVEDLGSELDGAGAEEICETPCVTTLARGQHRLVFHRDGRDDEVEVEVGARPRAHRRVMSLDSGEHTDYIAIAASGLVVGGFGLALIDPLTRVNDNFSSASDALLIAAAVGFGAALITGIVGVIMLIADPRQDREGVSTEWEFDLGN